MIEERIKKLIREADENVDVERLDEKTNLIDDYGFDSVNLVQLVVSIEDEFGIECEDDDLEMDKTSKYRELIKIIEKKLCSQMKSE